MGGPLHAKEQTRNMRLDLHSHPQSPASVVNEFWVAYSWLRKGILHIKYYVKANIASVSLPQKADSVRADGLWENTCFELFLREQSARNYCEFNFSPSGCWAAYQFSAYREDMADLELAEPPHIDFETSDKHIEMEVTLDLSGLAQASAYEVAFSAVIADKSGGKSYWALSHPQAKPDFHHEGSFTHQLKAADSL